MYIINIYSNNKGIYIYIGLNIYIYNCLKK